MAQHRFRREYDERLAPRPQRLSAQQVEVLRGGGRLRDLDIVLRGELHVAFHARAGMLWTLYLVAVREEHDEAGEQTPLGFARGEELVDDDLRAVGEIAE